MSYGFSWRNLSERDHLEDSGMDGRLILILILNKVGGCGLVQPASEYKNVPGFCKHSNETSGSMKRGDFFFLTN